MTLHRLGGAVPFLATGVTEKRTEQNKSDKEQTKKNAAEAALRFGDILR